MEMKEYKIIIDDITIEAESIEDAEDIAIDVINDIAGDGEYKLEEK